MEQRLGFGMVGGIGAGGVRLPLHPNSNSQMNFNSHHHQPHPQYSNLGHSSTSPSANSSMSPNASFQQAQLQSHRLVPSSTSSSHPPPTMDVFATDVYSTAFTIPRNAGAAAFDTPTLMVGADGGVVVNNHDSTQPSSSVNHPQPQPPGSLSAPSLTPPIQPATTTSSTTTPAPAPTSRMGSMRSRFPPSVKAFMPSAFGGSKRTSERIAEVVPTQAPTPSQTPTPGNSKGEKSDGQVSDQETESSNTGTGGGQGQEEGKGREDREKKNLVGEETNLASLTQSSIQRQVQDRDSRSTVGTRSSVDFSTNGSAVAASTAPSTSGPTGNEHSRSQSYNSQHSPSVQRKDELGHSASSSVSGGGAGGGNQNSTQSHRPSTSSSSQVTGAIGVGGGGHSRSKASADLDDSINRLVHDTMSSHQCLVSFTQVQASEAQASAALNQAFPRQMSSYSPSPVPSPHIGQHTPLPFPSPSPQMDGMSPLPSVYQGQPSKSYHPLNSDPTAPGMSGMRGALPLQGSQAGSVAGGQQAHGSQGRRGYDSRQMGPGGPDALPTMLGFGGPNSHMDINTSSVSLPLNLSGNHPSQTYNSFLHSSASRTPNDPSTPASMTSSLPHGGNSNAGGPGSHSGPAPSGPRLAQFNFYLSGGASQVMAARGAILRDNPFKARASIKVPRADVLLDASQPTQSPVIGTGQDLSSSPSIGAGRHGSSSPPESAGLSSPTTSSETLKPEVRRKLDELATLTKTHVAMIGTETHGQDLGYGLESERHVELVISGPFESVEQARIRLLVLLDEFSGLHAESCEIDYKLHNIVGGRKRAVIQTIQEETATNVYLASPFAGVLGAPNNRPQGIASRLNTVYITGEFFGVQRAKDMLFQVSVHKSKCIISRDTVILPRKLDWLLLERLEELRNIMLDNGTFINLPVIGSQASLVSVYGDNRVSIERSIRCMMQLASQFYTASLYLLPLSYEMYNMSSPALNPSQMTPVLKNISNLSGAEIVFKRDCFEVHGLESEVRTGVKLLLDLEMINSYNFQVHFQIELANEHREFISGKKNGKINKIMKQCNVRIKFETFNDYNFLIEISGNDRQGTLQGLSFLQEELPAEVSFHVPEAYHKRIIGVGGKNIQRIMKKYGVYVKFSNAEEFSALGGYVENEDNVIARTPAKNAINLENLKHAVMELITPKDKDFLTETIPVSRRYQRTLLGEKAIFIHDIESKTSSLVRFPPRELGSDLVSIFGPEAQIHIAAQMLLDHVPFEAEFRTPDSAALAQIINTQEYGALTQRLKRDLNIHVLPPVRQPHNSEAVFRLRLNRSNTDFLPTAKDLIEDFLVSRNIGVYASEERARSDSFASSFPHFANKLISSIRHDSTDSLQADAARYNERRLRPAASTPDIKALFDSPAHAARNYTTTNLTSPFVNPSMYTSPYGEGHSRVASVNSSDVWGAPPQVQQSRHAHSNSNSSGIQVQFPQQGTPLQQQSQLHHMSEDVNLLQTQGGEGVEERMRELRKPRSFGHRAQSLDIGAMAAEQQATALPRGGANLSYAGGNGGMGTYTPPAGSAPPNMGSYPFTNNGGSSHHGSSNSISRMTPGAGGMPNQATTDEVSRVLAQLAFDRN